MLLASLGNFFGLDTLIIIGVIALLFGGKKLPELAKSLGASIREFRKGKDTDHLNDKPS
jgi:sec-independent protein translocase protein TatA